MTYKVTLVMRGGMLLTPHFLVFQSLSLSLSPPLSLSLPLTHFQPGVGQNIALHAKGFVFLVYSASLFSSQYLFQTKGNMNHNSESKLIQIVVFCVSLLKTRAKCM